MGELWSDIIYIDNIITLYSLSGNIQVGILNMH